MAVGVTSDHLNSQSRLAMTMTTNQILTIPDAEVEGEADTIAGNILRTAEVDDRFLVVANNCFVSVQIDFVIVTCSVSMVFRHRVQREGRKG